MRLVCLVCACLLTCPAAALAGYREGEVRELTERAGFGAWAERVGAVAQPTAIVQRRILERAPRRLGTSRLGGLPDLPRGTSWPRCRGRRLSFLGQFRLRDLPMDAAALRSHGGLLLVFTHVQLDPGDPGFATWAGRCATVVHAAPGARLTRRRPPGVRPTYRLRPAELTYRMAPDVPDVGLDLRSLAAPLSDLEPDHAEAWWRLRDRLLAGRGTLRHRLLGYVDTPNGGGSCYARTQRPAGAWRHLATIGWDPRLGFEVADAGRLQIALPAEDLAAGHFDRACGIFDSA